MASPPTNSPVQRSSRNCSASNAAPAVSLPVLGEASSGGGGKIRASKNGRRRAVVLTLVHVLIIIHIIHWLSTGSTLTPIEPSESMEFAKRGVINAGLIFFSVALLSTLILGRWFCGWGCHLVALQDGCGWLMKKFGVRPKPFRSRTLIYVPLLLGLYMFVWPAFYRLALAPWLGTSNRLPPWGLESHLTTSDFWGTFPGWVVAVPFLLICGFACVYFLGQKGFCTYGCPYGGFFAPLDQYAVGRIRVTDDCEQCGHCTAVCTSNVRVHEEVRDYGMVVDPGCMKCMDCVSVCPNDALYFGFGKAPGWSSDVKKTTAAHHHDSAPAARRYDMSLRQDLAVAGVFALVFFAFRGEYARFPLLMAAGTAMVMTFIIWHSWRVLRDPNVRLHRWQLKLRGRLRPAGFAFILLAAAVIGLVVQSSTVNAFSLVASQHDDRVAVPPVAVFLANESLDEDVRDHASKAITWYQRAATVSVNGLGLAKSWRSMIDMRLAWMHSVRGDFAQAEKILRQILAREGAQPNEMVVSGFGMVLAAQPTKHDEALAWYREALVERLFDGRPAQPIMLEEFMAWAQQTDQIVAAATIVDDRLERHPNNVHTIVWAALLKLELGRPRKGIQLLHRALELDPQNANAREALQLALARFGE